jgi:hypothetical protein
MLRLAMAIAMLLVDPGVGGAWEPVSLRVSSPHNPRTEWGRARLADALTVAGYKISPAGPLVVDISVGSAGGAQLGAGGGPESYRVLASGNRVSIVGSDAAGAMYGCLDLAEQVRRTRRLPEQLDRRESPAMSLRGTCILLMKLGTYDYPVTPKEFPFFYDRELWRQYLDFLAENRFNYVAFWNGHPFDYFVKLDKYPEAQQGMEPGLLERNHDMLLWLAKEAERRNIWLMFQFYNIHTSVYFQKAHGLPAWNPKPSPLLADYTGYCIERFVSEFPSVGLYVCPGEALGLEYTDAWINDVIFAAVQRTGKTPPIMVRAWAIDLPHMRKLAGRYPRLYTERKFNVEMIAGTEVDPENRQWAKITGEHVVNIHCMANLEPFRWSPPSYVARCVASAVRDGGATGLHLYPRKAWRWPYGCDRVGRPELQWRRDWMWFEAWARYAWNPQRDPAAERAYWTTRLADRYGSDAAPHVLAAFERSADVLPGIQRLLWLGNDNHTVVAAGATLDQLAKAAGVPFLPTPGTVRIPRFIEGLKRGEKLEGQTPVQFLAQKAAEAEAALGEAEIGARAAKLNQADAERIASDLRAVAWVARFHRDKVEAAVAKSLADAGIDKRENRDRWTASLRWSVDDFRQLTDLTKGTYDSLSDVPAWNPTRALPCPYHWSDLLPLYEKELAENNK